MELRVARDDDLDALRAVYRRASLSNERDRDALLAHPDALVFAGDAIRDGRTLVAVVDGRLVGFATLDRSRDGVAELEDLFVDPDHQRRGIARVLLTRLVERRRVAGDRAIEVTANLDALGFYESMGFVVIGETETRFAPAPRMRLEIRARDNESP